MAFLISPSLLVFRLSCISSLPSTLILGLVVRCLKSAACASGLPLYLAAVSLKEGPSFLADTEWHFMQPLFFISASAPATSTDWACTGAIAAAAQSPITNLQRIFSLRFFVVET